MSKKKIKTRKWDASEYLDSPEMIHEYLKVSFEDGDSDQLMIAIANVAKARGMSEIARKTKLSRQNLYKALTPGSYPKFDTVKKVVEALGCKLVIS
ncbi:MAG: addiction module antidote protein [Planctomycetota bacterium]|jgi:probable addiction module antidote protein